MPRYKFSEIATNVTEKRMPTLDDMATYIAPNNLDTSTLSVPEYGYKVPLNGLKLVMNKGDMLFGRREPQLKHAAIAPHDGVFSAHGMIFHAKEKVISKDFFPFFISSDCFFDTAIKISVGSLSPTVNWKDLKDIEFTIPEREKQEEYAELLWGIVRLKRAYRELIRQSDELIKSEFIEMFGDPMDNDKGWKVRPISEVCEIVTGNTPPRKHPEYYGDYIEWIKSDNISSDQVSISHAAESLSESGAKVGRIVPAGSILMTCIAGSLNTIGNIGITDRSVAFNQQINALVPNSSDAWYLYYLLQMIRPKIHEITNKALKCILSKGALSTITVIDPDRELQNAFSEKAQQSDKAKAELEKSNETLNNLQKIIVSDMFQCHM